MKPNAQGERKEGDDHLLALEKGERKREMVASKGRRRARKKYILRSRPERLASWDAQGGGGRIGNLGFEVLLGHPHWGKETCSRPERTK